MKAKLSPLRLGQILAVAVWLLLWARFDVEFYSEGDDLIATPGLIVMVGVIPTVLLGWLAGWLQDSYRTTYWIVVLFTVSTAVGWAALVTLLSGDIYYCDDCEVHGIHRVTGFIGLEILLLAFWLTIRRVARRRRAMESAGGES